MANTHDEAIEQLQSVLSLPKEVCRQLLEASNWDVEAAAVLAMDDSSSLSSKQFNPPASSSQVKAPASSFAAATPAPATVTAGIRSSHHARTVTAPPAPNQSSSSFSSSSSPSAPSAREAPAPLPPIPDDGRVSAFLSYIPLLGPILNVGWKFAVSIIWGNDLGLEREAEHTFLRGLRAQYPNLPEVVSGSYMTALRTAIERRRMLFVYIHCDSHQETEAFVADTLSSDSLRDYLGNNLVTWAGDIRNPDCFRLAQTLGATGFPFVAVLAPPTTLAGQRRNENKVVVVLRNIGMVSSDELIALMVVRGEAHTISSRLENQRIQSDNTDRMLRAQQDLEYQRALEQERIKSQMEEKKQEEKAQDERIKFEKERQEKSAREEAEKNQHLEEERLAREQNNLLLSIPAEPAEGTTGALNVQVRLPGGAKVQRRFMPEDMFRALIKVELANPKLQYQVISNFPRRVWSDPNMKLKEFGMGRSILLIAEELVTEHDN